uniref:Obg-like ATPase homolog n=1 Tax=Albugo laibachii Nc14 TaxID=890382 RepID=F0WPI4_9STRA|nr:GTPdependent nucleic acidbinding protein engD putat [Albugo laibachii Nc14]|eukprot:CCA23232.1 GTPdependent nucleic acidbinding protein engD putat [Albugo laibachii Nc14]
MLLRPLLRQHPSHRCIWKNIQLSRRIHRSVGIVGLPNVGKSTFFNALTKTQIAQAANYPFCTIDPNIALTAVPDERVRQLAKLENSQKTIETQVGNQFLNNIRQVSVIAHVLRCFEDTDIVHVDSRIDPLSDLITVRTELALADLQTVEKKLENMAKKKILHDAKYAAILNVLERSKDQLENDSFLQASDITEREERIQFDQLQLLTAKKVLYLCNVAEAEAKTGNKMTQDVSKMVESEGNVCLVISAALEEAAATFEDDATQLEYLESCGMMETGLIKVIHACRDILQLQTFYTVGPKEARAWSIRRGSTAAEAAATIHSDFARLLIRAETISFNDFVQAGSVKVAKEKGLTRAEGRDYICQDGDVFNFLVGR